MKRVKILLAVIVILSTAGGVLAFKMNEARRGIRVCTAPTINGECPLDLMCQGAPIFRKLGQDEINLCYTSYVPNVSDCRFFKCTISGETLPE
jgi:hypothetical protein